MNLLNTKLKTEQKGIAAVEFALFLPFIIVLWIGIVELTEWQLSSRKVTIATLSAADLISQQIEVNNDRLNDYVAAIKEIMKPSLVESELGVFLASMSLDGNGNPQIDWKQDSNSSNGDTIPIARP